MMRGCPVCDKGLDGDFPIEGIAPQPWILKRCGACGFVYLQNPPGYGTQSTAFAWERTFEAEKQARRERQAAFERAVRNALLAVKIGCRRLVRRNKLRAIAHALIDRPGRVLDLGCDSGYNAQDLPAHAIPIGIEISETLAAQATEPFHARVGFVLNAPALEGLKSLDSGSCGGAVAISYLEHEARPLEVLRELIRVLQPGSPVILKVPNHACWLRFLRGRHWSGYRFPDHMNYFCPKSLARMLESAGYQIARFGLLDRFPTSDNMWCVARKPADEHR